MRGFALLPLIALAGCSASGGGSPPLAPRAAEAIDPRVPVPDPAAQAAPSADLVRELDSLVARAVAGDEAFRAAAANADLLAAAAGAPQSESWILAQQALSAAVAARAPVTRAMGDIDSIAARRIQQLGGIGAADLAAIQAASKRVHAIDSGEAATIDRLQARLAG